jgi:beta-galactosidase
MGTTDIAGTVSANGENTLPRAQVQVGVDYYPEQWPEDEMLADMHSIRNDLGADIIRVGEFMWQEIERQDGVFNFTKLDSILDAAASLGLRVMLGTPTATMPAWLYEQHPDVVTVGPDSPDGYKAAAPVFGGRRQYSFNSATYLAYAKRLVAKLVERYGQHPAVAVWQVDNELGHEVRSPVRLTNLEPLATPS